MHSANHRSIYRCLAALILIGVLGACTKMDEPYKEVIKDGAIIYPARPDSLKALSGNNRIVLSWIVSDPKINRFMIYWNQGADSLELPVTSAIDGHDTMRVPIENLTEGIYNFKVYSFDRDNHQSIASEATGTAYGQQYASTITNRFIDKLSVVNGTVLIAWTLPDNGTLGEQITYKDQDDSTRTLFVPVSDTAKLPDFASGDSVHYRTLYLPDPLAVDTFYTRYESVYVEPKLFEVELDRLELSVIQLPGDYTIPNGASNTVDQIFQSDDGIRESNTYISKVDGHPLPQAFTVDLGGTYKLTRMKLFQRGDAGKNASRLYAGGNVRKFEVWGSLTPDLNYDPDEHGGDFGPSWQLMATCTVDRPSGNIISTSATRSDNTTEDIGAAEAGHEFFFDPLGKVRFIRIKVLENWDYADRAYVNIAAIAFWRQ